MAAPADTAGKADNWHRIGQHEAAHYRFDRAGNLTHHKDANGTLTTLAWDANQRLIASTRTKPGNEAQTTTYAYDPLNSAPSEHLPASSPKTAPNGPEPP